MNATDSLLIPLFDAGRLSGLTDGALGARYRFWRDQDGVRHVFSVYAADDAPDYPEALAIAVRRTPAGNIALWAGMPGEAAKRAARRYQTEEIHIYVFGDAPPASLLGLLVRRQVTTDPLALPAPVRETRQSERATSGQRHAA